MTDTTDDVFEPAVLVKPGTPLVKPHNCLNHLPSAGYLVDAPDEDEDGEWVPNPLLANGAVYRCTCDTLYRYFENRLWFTYRYKSLGSHWLECDENGRVWKMVDVAPWWKRMWAVEDMQWQLVDDFNV